jgi:hypothetical protein
MRRRPISFFPGHRRAMSRPIRPFLRPGRLLRRRSGPGNEGLCSRRRSVPGSSLDSCFCNRRRKALSQCGPASAAAGAPTDHFAPAALARLADLALPMPPCPPSRSGASVGFGGPPLPRLAQPAPGARGCIYAQAIPAEARPPLRLALPLCPAAAPGPLTMNLHARCEIF